MMTINTKTGERKLTFAEWFEEVYGITWEQFDNNYSDAYADEVYEEYEEYWNA